VLSYGGVFLFYFWAWLDGTLLADLLLGRISEKANFSWRVSEEASWTLFGSFPDLPFCGDIRG
jgi:hypothetical protein